MKSSFTILEWIWVNHQTHPQLSLIIIILIFFLNWIKPSAKFNNFNFNI
jgi:hypothetical protein